MPQTFILGRLAAGLYRFRLSGGLLRDLHGRDLRGADFADLWDLDARLTIQTGLERARRMGEPLVLRARALADGQLADLEIALLPLTNEAGVVDRMLGLYQPLSPLVRLQGLVVDSLLLVSANAEPAVGRPNIRLAAVGGQRVG